MRRYVRLANIGSEPDAESYLARTVFEPEPKPRYSGLLDANGVKLYAVDEMQPIGFVRLRVPDED